MWRRLTKASADPHPHARARAREQYSSSHFGREQRCTTAITWWVHVVEGEVPRDSEWRRHCL